VNVRGDFLHKFSGDIGISAVQRNTDERPPLIDRLTIAPKAGLGSLPTYTCQMASILGGNASRLEVYALFVAAVVLIGGGISGAIVVTSSEGETSAPVTIVETSSTTVTTAVLVEVTVPSTTTAPINQPPPPTSRYVDPPPETVTPDQPVQDFSAYCTMPNMIDTFTGQNPNDPISGLSAVRQKLTDAGCPYSALQQCFTDSLPANTVRIVSQEPSPGTLVHRSFGTVTLSGEVTSVGFSFPPEQSC